MPSKTVAVGSSVGLHARPAQIIAEAVEELDVEVLIGIPGDEPVDASSSLLIMTLGAGPGDLVEVSSEVGYGARWLDLPSGEVTGAGGKVAGDGGH